MKFIETKSRRWVPGAGGGGSGEQQFNADRVSAGKMRKFWRWMVVTAAQQCERT